MDESDITIASLPHTYGSERDLYDWLIVGSCEGYDSTPLQACLM